MTGPTDIDNALEAQYTQHNGWMDGWDIMKRRQLCLRVAFKFALKNRILVMVKQ